MTAPTPGPVFRAPGLGLNQASQNFAGTFFGSQQLDLQRKQLEAQKQNQERNRALQLFAAGIQQAGFETTEAATELESTLGIKGFSKELAGLKTKASREEARQFEEWLTGMNVDEKTTNALRSSFVAGKFDFNADEITRLYNTLAPEQLNALDQMRLFEIQNRVAKQRLDFANKSPENQRTAFGVLGQPLGQFVPGVDYVGMIDDFAKEAAKEETERDPSRLVMSTALSLMNNFKDILGRPGITPSDAIGMAASMVGSIFPGAMQDFQPTPMMLQQADAMGKAVSGINMIRDNERNKVKTLGRRFKNDTEIEDWLRESLRAEYGPAVEPILDQIMRLAFQRTPEK